MKFGMADVKLVIVALVIVAIAAQAAAPGKGWINGAVTDSQGAAIAKARIVFHWDPSGSTVGLSTNVGLAEDLVVWTDEKGLLAAELPPGFYDLFVSAPGFSPSCQKVRVREGDPVVVKVQLRVNALVIRELGDKF